MKKLKKDEKDCEILLTPYKLITLQLYDIMIITLWEK